MPNPFQSVAYLQIRRGWLGVQIITWAGRAGEWSGSPDVRILPDSRRRIHAYAVDDPRVRDAVHARAFTAFTHPRVVFDCFDETRLTVGVYLRKAGWRPGSGLWTFVVHLRDEWLASLTDIEQKAVIDLGKRLGASRVLIVSAGRELSAPELLQIARRPHAAAGQPPIALDHL